MRKVSLLFAPLIAASALYACESESGSSSSGAVTPFEAGGVDAPITPMQDGALPDTATPDTAPPGPIPVTVTVSGLDGKLQEGVDVVFHDATGAVVAQSKTNAQGAATSPRIPVAMASALLGTATSRHRHVITWAAVKAGDMLATTNIAADDEAIAGSYNVAYVNAPGAIAYEAYLSACYNFRSNSGASTINVMAYPSCLRPGNANNILVRALDEGGGDFAYGFVKSAPQASGQTPVAVNVPSFASSGTFTLTATNRPNTFTANLELYEIAGTLPFRNRSSRSFTSDLNNAVFNGIATNFDDGLQVVSYGLQGASEHRIVQRYAVGANALIDYGQPLPNIQSASLDNTSYKRPKLTWTVAAPGLGASDGGAVTIRWSEQNESAHGWTIVLPPTATDATFPALPTTATAWLPPDPGDAGRPRLFQPEILFVESDLIPSADSFRAQAGRVLPFGTYAIIGNVVMPAVGKLRAVQFYDPGNER